MIFSYVFAVSWNQLHTYIKTQKQGYTSDAMDHTNNALCLFICSEEKQIYYILI